MKLLLKAKNHIPTRSMTLMWNFTFGATADFIKSLLSGTVVMSGKSGSFVPPKVIGISRPSARMPKTLRLTAEQVLLSVPDTAVSTIFISTVLSQQTQVKSISLMTTEHRFSGSVILIGASATKQLIWLKQYAKSVFHRVLPCIRVNPSEQSLILQTA